jgi:hypothetical protein
METSKKVEVSYTVAGKVGRGWEEFWPVAASFSLQQRHAPFYDTRQRCRERERERREATSN